MTKWLFALCLLIPWPAVADLTFPVAACESYQWQVIDTSDCSMVGGPTAFPGFECGDPGYGSQFKLLRVTPGGATPSYDGNLRHLTRPYIVCGPDTGTCYDTTTVHAGGTGCTATDALEQVDILVDLTVDQRVEALGNVAGVVLDDAIDEDKLGRSILLLSAMLSTLADGSSLPTNAQGVNWQVLYDVLIGDNTSSPYLEIVSDLKTPSQEVMVRANELYDRIQDAETCRLDDQAPECATAIQDGEMDQGWPEAAQ